MVQRLRLHASNTGGKSSISSQESKILYTIQCVQIFFFKSLMSLESRIVYADIEDRQDNARTGFKKEGMCQEQKSSVSGVSGRLVGSRDDD